METATKHTRNIWYQALRFSAYTGLLILFVSALALAQESFRKTAPSVTMAPAGIPTITRGQAGSVELVFHIAAGYHINSNTPSEEYLIPTSLRLDAPTDIVAGRITYPRGQMVSFPFSPNEKLSVYSGTFSLAVVIRPFSTVLPGKYAFHGSLRYQACDNSACYPPKQLPVDFEVKIVKPRPPHRRNPAQSPHVHG
jgi:Thiol:disulfide interchange protein DsbD, N-terminal